MWYNRMYKAIKNRKCLIPGVLVLAAGLTILLVLRLPVGEESVVQDEHFFEQDRFLPQYGEGDTVENAGDTESGSTAVTHPEETKPERYEDIDSTQQEDSKYHDEVQEETEQAEPIKTEEETVEAFSSLQFLEFRDKIVDHISSLEGLYGIYCIDLSSDMEFGINGYEEFYAASTVKVPLALYLCMLMEQRAVDPEKLLEYTEEDYEEGTGELKDGEFGSKYTVWELLELSIKVSDNVATNMLLRMLGQKNLKDFMRSLGGVVVDDSKNITCPRDMAVYLREVYEFSRKSDYGRKLVDLLENTVFNGRLPKQLPKGTEIAHKIGNWHGEFHDVGIVFAQRPYVISVMSKNVEMEDSFEEIANISRMFFDFFSENEKK